MSAPIKQYNTFPQQATSKKKTNADKVVFGILTLLAAAVFLVVFFVARGVEDDDFEHQYRENVRELELLVNRNIKDSVSVFGSLSASVTSYAVSQNSEWPFVTVPDFALRNKDLREVAKAERVIFAPLVFGSALGTWQSYTQENSEWIADSYVAQGLETSFNPSDIPPIHAVAGGAFQGSFRAPVWQITEMPSSVQVINTDLLSHSQYKKVFETAESIKAAAVSELVDLSALLGESNEEPSFLLVEPVYEDTESQSTLTGYYAGIYKWSTLLGNILPASAGPIDAVISNNRDQTYTYRVSGSSAAFVDAGAKHDSGYKSKEYQVSFEGILGSNQDCKYEISFYPTEELEDEYKSGKPFLYGFVAAGGVLLSMYFFAMYLIASKEDRGSMTKQEPEQAPQQSASAVINAVLPAAIADRLAELSSSSEEEEDDDLCVTKKTTGLNKAGLKNFLNEGVVDNFQGPSLDSKPIADLFPETTVLFADISGFTAWSSVREPSQVFTLLETIYHSFDEIARRHGVFKVETVGDCYVAVTGLPEPRADHAVVMAIFARECQTKMIQLVNELEVTLGPDTADLAIRVGLHSGPVTAGVLRGERARFQLFGDTMNSAARMEHTGVRKRIHVSQETADLLVAGGKKDWLRLREDVIVAKGKGALETYWVLTNEDLAEMALAKDKQASEKAARKVASTSGAKDQKVQRLIDWNCELLVQLLKKIVVRHKAIKPPRDTAEKLKAIEKGFTESRSVLNEVVEIIKLPKFVNAGDENTDLKKVDLGDDVNDQLREYVSILASMYRDNPFHCYEHASHVTMSVSKLLSRIVAPDNVEGADAEALHDTTYGITSDPLTQFSVILSALIHDVDHRGVPNFVLCQEDPHLASAYNSKSVAEQNSVDIAWASLMDDRFADFRSCIYGNESELRRFRQLIVNSVMATDIFDKELTTKRKERWNKAFSEEPLDESHEDTINRKATIVIEHLIQASDVSHTMQHWHVYTKWNKRLFEEMYGSFRAGRWNNDPSGNWYKGEIGFFEGYVIPLANKLKECGVFGVSSDEYLNYAKKNVDEWKKRGEELVETMVEQMKEKFDELEEEEEAEEEN